MDTQSKLPWFLGAAALGLGALLLNRKDVNVAIDQADAKINEALTDAGKFITEAVADVNDWASNVVKRVSAHEGSYASLNRNSDGVGLSFGILQWSQGTGALGQLLQRMFEVDPSTFIQIFGSDYQQLLGATRAGALDPVGGAVLWQEPWVSRFRLAGKEPVFQRVQDSLATQGPYFAAAERAAKRIGIRTERSLALFFDTAVQQGPGFATRLADRLAGYAYGPANSKHEFNLLILHRYAEEAPAHFRRLSVPTQPYPVSHIHWQQVGPSEWHAFAKSFDLFETVYKRRMAIVMDPALSDLTINEGIV